MYILMDEKDQVIFKGKFTLCVVLLNIIIFSAAVAVCVWAIVDDSYWFKLPVVIAAAIVCVAAVLGCVVRGQWCGGGGGGGGVPLGNSCCYFLQRVVSVLAFILVRPFNLRDSRI